MANDDSVGTVLVAFLLGAVAGAAVALLYAPAPGEDTRKVLSERAREGRTKANDAVKQGRQYVNRQRETITTAIEKGKEAFERARSGDEAEEKT